MATASIFVFLFALFLFLGTACRLLYTMKRGYVPYSVLADLRTLRHELMIFMLNGTLLKPAGLTRAEYTEARQLYDVVDGSIQNYKTYERVVFDPAKTADYMRQYRRGWGTVKPTASAELQEFYLRFIKSSATAFLFYVPLLRSREVLQVLRWLQRAFSRYLRHDVVEIAEQIRKDALGCHTANDAKTVA